MDYQWPQEPFFLTIQESLECTVLSKAQMSPPGVDYVSFDTFLW